MIIDLIKIIYENLCFKFDEVYFLPGLYLAIEIKNDLEQFILVYAKRFSMNIFWVPVENIGQNIPDYVFLSLSVSHPYRV